MKTTWLRQWNRWQFLTTQLTLISVLFLYLMAALDSSLVIALFLTIAISSILSQWIGYALHPLIDQARLQGDFKVMRSAVMVHFIHLLAGLALFGASYSIALEALSIPRYINLGLIVIGLLALDKVLSATLRAQASAIVLQAHAVRRSVLLVGLISSLLLQAQPWNDLLLFVVLILSPLSSVIRQMIGYGQTFKEFRYRRQFEDSGKHQSLLSLFVTLTTRYASSLVQISLPLGLLLVLGLTQLIALPEATDALTSALVLFLAVLALARTVVATCTPDMSPWREHVQTSNHAGLRQQLAAISEQLLYRSLILGLVWFGTGFVLGPNLYRSMPELLSSTAVVTVSSFYLFDQRSFGLFRPAQQWLIVVGAVVIFGLNSLLLLIYYPAIGLMIGWVMSVLWLHSASLVVWTRSFDFELRIHASQSAKMIGIAMASLLVNASIYWLLSQFPLGVGAFVEQLVFLGLFAIITSVVMYSLTYALGVHRSLKSRTELLQQLSTQFIDYEEEEAIW